MKSALSFRTAGWMAVSCLLFSRSPAAEPMAGYLMGYFTESPTGRGDSSNLQIATSEDGLDWMPLNQNEPVLVSRLGQKGLRDPFFLRKKEGGFVVLATNLTGLNRIATPEIHVCETADFITFDNARLVRLHDTPMRTLAPEAFLDPDRNQYGIIWTGDTDRRRIYVNYTTDFTHVTPHELFFDPGQDVRDATLAQDPEQGNRFLYYTDGVANRLRGTRSATLAPRGFDSTPYTRPLGGTIIEAPLLVKALQGNRWFLYGDSDSPVNGEFYAWQTDDISSDAWKEIDKRDYNTPLNVKHATVIPITRAEMDNLIAHWGRPKWNRIKSWNFPDCLVRHDNEMASISYYPFDPYQDSQWRIVPGLAGATGISFESVNSPGQYLRAVAEHVMLAKDDGSPGFKAKATFVKVPGLANSSWSSFHSFSSPDLYLRHANYFLRLEAINIPLDREDATFRIVY
ncbi:MAG: AbfB domain-containing protein [Luteolibacter sp.]|uniref:AbfB domain-containing protein n=1 Tax=Luteolibacter sp. TaxID=1962973 RepID=UPI0032638DF7